MTQLSEKVLYCIQMMKLIRWLTNYTEDDYEKRIIARSLFIYLDAFLKLTPNLKNQLRASGVNVKTVHKALNQLAKDYETFYAKIRDKLTAHRQDLPFLEMIEAWNEIDDTVVNLFIDESSGIYTSLSRLSSTIPSYSELSDISNSQLKAQLQSKLSSNHGLGQIVEGADSLSITRPYSTPCIPVHEIQERGYQIVSIFDTIRFVKKLYSATDAGQNTQELVKAMLIVDVINLIDNLYPKTGSKAKHKMKSFLEMAQEYQFGQLFGVDGSSILKDAYDSRNIVTEDKLRNIRNKIAAHIDSIKGLETLIADLSEITIGDIDRIFNPAWGAFEGTCRIEPRAFDFLVHDMPLNGVVGLEPNDAFNPYTK